MAGLVLCYCFKLKLHTLTMHITGRTFCERMDKKQSYSYTEPTCSHVATLAKDQLSTHPNTSLPCTVTPLLVTIHGSTLVAWYLIFPTSDMPADTQLPPPPLKSWLWWKTQTSLQFFLPPCVCEDMLHILFISFLQSHLLSFFLSDQIWCEAPSSSCGLHSLVGKL